jgi:hypothetical protein
MEIDRSPLYFILYGGEKERIEEVNRQVFFTLPILGWQNKENRKELHTGRLFIAYFRVAKQRESKKVTDRSSFHFIF